MTVEAPNVPTPQPFVIDVSSNQDHPIDWHQVKLAGCVGVILKATQGLTYVNPFFAGDLKDAESAGLPVLAYHFATFESPRAEADFFVKHAGARARVLDIETSTNLGWATRFLQCIQRKVGLAPTQTMLYGSASTIPRKGVTSLLWIADYSESPGKPCDMWQYTESGRVDGITNAVDVSRWTGTQKAFDVFFA